MTDEFKINMKHKELQHDRVQPRYSISSRDYLSSMSTLPEMDNIYTTASSATYKEMCDDSIMTIHSDIDSSDMDVVRWEIKYVDELECKVDMLEGRLARDRRLGRERARNLRENLEQSENLVRELRQEIRARDIEIGERVTAFGTLRKKIIEKDGDISDMKGISQHLVNIVKERNGDIAKLRDEIEEMKAEAKDRDSNISTLLEKNEKLMEERNNIRVKDKSSSVREVDIRVIELKKENENFRMESEKTARELKEENSRLRDRIEELKKENDSLKERLESKSRDRDSLELAKDIEIKLVRGEILAKDAKILELAGGIGGLRVEVDNAIREKNSNVSALSEETKKVAAAREEIKSRDVKISELEQQIEHLKTEIKQKDKGTSEPKKQDEDPRAKQIREEKMRNIPAFSERQEVIIDLVSHRMIPQTVITGPSLQTRDATPSSLDPSLGYQNPSTASGTASISSSSPSHSPLLATLVPSVNFLRPEGWEYTKLHGGDFRDQTPSEIGQLFAYAFFGDKSVQLIGHEAKLWTEEQMSSLHEKDDPRIMALYRGMYAAKIKSGSKPEYAIRCMLGRGDREIRTPDRVLGILREFFGPYGVVIKDNGLLIHFSQR